MTRVEEMEHFMLQSDSGAFCRQKRQKADQRPVTPNSMGYRSK